MDNEKWIRDGRHWHEYPLGTKAKALMGGYWIKTERGWHWPGGGTFPTPGGDATGEVCLPDTNNTQLPAEVLEDIIVKSDEVYEQIDQLALPARDKVIAIIENVLTEYATKLHQAQLEIDTARKLLQTIYDLKGMAIPSYAPIYNEIKQFLDGTK
jgi:hypothetical protein